MALQNTENLDLSQQFLLEKPSRLSHSLIWNWSRSFYEEHGVEAWKKNIVPSFMTTNSCIAKMYCRVILGFLRDCFGPKAELLNVTFEQPVYIVELGAGHGKFGFLVLKKLMALKEFFPKTKCKWPFKYIMTDFTDSSLAFWKNHRCLKEFVEMGVLDFAKIDAEHDSDLSLQISGEWLNCATVRNPVCVIANYLFDTLRQEAFRVVDGNLQLAKMSTYVDIDVDQPDVHPEPDLLDPALIKRAKYSWDYTPIGEEKIDNFFTGRQADVNPVLKKLISQESLKNSSILIPVGAISCMRNMMDLSRDRLLILSGDKAWSHENEMQGLNDPHIAIHGSFSMIVNYNAIRHYAESRGAISMHTPYMEGFKCCAIFMTPNSLSDNPPQPQPQSHGDLDQYARRFADMLDGDDQDFFSEARMSFKDSICTFGPDTFSTLQRAIKDETKTPTLKHVMALLRLSAHDSDVFYKFRSFIIDRVGYPYANRELQRDIRYDIACMYAEYFPLSLTKDVAFEVGTLFMGMKDYSEAIPYFEDSMKDCGEHPVTYYNMGVCHYHARRFPAAVACFSSALNLKAEYEEAEQWRQKAEAQMEAILVRRTSGGQS